MRELLDSGFHRNDGNIEEITFCDFVRSKRRKAGNPLKYWVSRMKTPNDSKQKTDSIVPPIILPEGYNGKILLISVSSARIDNTVILRSGDLWHREILRNTENEIKNHGITDAQLHQLGGAWVRFEPDGTIIIHGRSQEFGPCDKACAADLIRGLFPKSRVEIRN